MTWNEKKKREFGDVVNFLDSYVKKTDDDDVDDDDDDDDEDDVVDGTFPFQRRRIAFDSWDPKDIQDSLHPISVTSVDVTQNL